MIYLIIIIIIIIALIGLLRKYYALFIEPIDLPTFTSESDLLSSKWLIYLQELYGKSFNPIFPFDLKEFDVLYTDKLEKAGIEYSIVKAPFCPLKEFQLTTTPGAHLLPVNSAQIYKKIKRKAVGANSWVEVSHGGKGNTSLNVGDDDSLVGNWLYAVKGSGIYFYTGKTRVYGTHAEAIQDLLGLECVSQNEKLFKFSPVLTKMGIPEDLLIDECSPQWKRMVTAAAKKGYDSIQFINHHDVQCYTEEYQQPIEIIDCDLSANSSYACGYKNPNTDNFRSKCAWGWNAEKKCNCSNPPPPNEFVGYLSCDDGHGKIILGSNNEIGWGLEKCRNGKKPDMIRTSEPKIFGPVIWPGLHIMAENYPEKADKKHIRGCQKFLEGLPYMLPCSSCGSHLLNYEKSGEERWHKTTRKACQNRTNLRRFLLTAHNSVNSNTGKKAWTEEEVRKHYCSIPACIDDGNEGWFEEGVELFYPEGKSCKDEINKMK